MQVPAKYIYTECLLYTNSYITYPLPIYTSRKWNSAIWRKVSKLDCVYQLHFPDIYYFAYLLRPQGHYLGYLKTLKLMSAQ